MIAKILNDYKTFSDSKINRIEYFKEKNCHNNKIKIGKIYMTSYNWTEDKYEDLILIFENIREFRFIELNDRSSTMITDALLKYENEEVIFDFFPIQYSDSVLRMDTKSDFLIRSEKIYLLKKDLNIADL